MCLKCVSDTPNHPKWFTSTIRHKLKIYCSKRRKYRSRQSSHTIEKLTHLKFDLQNEIVLAKSIFETSLINQYASCCNPKIFKYIRSLTKDNALPQCMEFNGTEATSDKHKAELFNCFFNSVYSTPRDIPIFHSAGTQTAHQLSVIFQSPSQMFTRL